MKQYNKPRVEHAEYLKPWQSASMWKIILLLLSQDERDSADSLFLRRFPSAVIKYCIVDYVPRDWMKGSLY